MSKPVHGAGLFGELRRLLGVRYDEKAPEQDRSGTPPAAASPARGDPPAELLLGIRSAVIEADLDRALGLADELAAYDGDLASRVRLLVSSFEYSSVLALVGARGPKVP
jgi:hypothetical protein